MKKIKILSTKKLSEDLRCLFNDSKFDFFHDDFISIHPLKFNLPEHNGSWIFTSKNIKTLSINCRLFGLQDILCLHF